MAAFVLRPAGQAALRGGQSVRGGVMPVRAQTDARRKASAEYKARQAAEGVVQLSGRVPPTTKAKLDKLSERHGSQNAALIAAIDLLAESDT